MRNRTVVTTLIAIAVVSVAIGIFWTVRTAPPSPRPWWAGKNAVVRVELWEPGKDMATVAMRMPKGMFDALIAFGLPARIEIGERHPIDLKTIWAELQRLPRGEKYKIQEGDGTVTIWIDIRDGSR